MNEQAIEETQGYKLAIAFKPFIDPKCTEHMEIVKDMAKAINGAFLKFVNQPCGEKMELLHEIDLLKKMLAFEKGERVNINGLVYQKGINENSFYTELNKV